MQRIYVIALFVAPSLCVQIIVRDQAIKQIVTNAIQRSFGVLLAKHSSNVACAKPEVDKGPLIIFQIQLDPSRLS